MKDLNKKKGFDRHWEEVFQDAEKTPPDGVWSRIDSTLSKEEAGHFKRRAFIYKLLAAASIVFAIGMGLLSLNYYISSGPSTEFSQLQVDDMPAPEQVDKTSGLSEALEDRNEESDFNNANSSSGIALTNDAVLDKIIERSNLATSEGNDGSNTEENEGSLIASTLLARNDLDSEASGVGDQQVALATLDILERQGIPMEHQGYNPQTIDHIYLIPIMPRGASKRRSAEKRDDGVLMASLDFSAGQFNPNFEQGASVFTPQSGAFAADSRSEMTALNATNKNILLVRSQGQDTEPELAYSYGANFGFKVSKRLLVQTGLAYRKASTTTTTTRYIEYPDQGTRIPVAPATYDLTGLYSVKGIEATNLNNQFEFASIPVRAGYVLIDKKVNLTLMAGVSSEFFINNSIEDESNFLQTLSSSDASDSPFRSVYFNGTVGTMLGYTFAKNYMVMLEPSYRMAINSFTKDGFYLSSYPSSFMLSFGVAYNFR